MLRARPVPDCLLTFLEKEESCELVGYLDSAGVPSDGIGHTGVEVKAGRKITRATALLNLRNDLHIAVERVYARVQEAVILALTEQQYAAILSFAFNAGANPSWGIWKSLNARRFDEVPVQLQRFVYVRDPKTKAMVKSRGLVNRRAAEVALWHEGDPTVSAVTPSSAAMREVLETPPAPMGAKPLLQSKTMFMGAGTAISGALVKAPELLASVQGGAKQIQGVVDSQAEHSTLLTAVSGHVAMVIVGLGVATMVVRWLDERMKRT